MSRPLILVTGARPNFMKVAALWEPLEAAKLPVPVRIVHTGQHYDAEMCLSFFSDLNIPAPFENLEVAPSRPAQQIAEIMNKFDDVLQRCEASAVLVVGDVNSTLACALTAVKNGISVIHVEAGLRSGDRTMPEEVNRILTDQIADLLFATESAAVSNLGDEGVDPKKVHLVGNVMIDTLKRILPVAVKPEETLRRIGRTDVEVTGKEGFVVLTLHRPSNVDHFGQLAALMAVFDKIGSTMPVLFPVHPRTRDRLENADRAFMSTYSNITFLPPVGYPEMLGLVKEGRMVFTDSGGIQEEAAALGVTCFTLRDSTERPVTVTEGTNTVIGTDPLEVIRYWSQAIEGDCKFGRIPTLWDGQSGSRIAKVIADWYSKRI